MDEKLTDLRQRAIDASTKFLRVRSAYLEAANLKVRKPESELIAAAEEYLRGTAPYDAALQELRPSLLRAGPSQDIAAELERTERLIEALVKEKRLGSKLIEHHMELIYQSVQSHSRQAKDGVTNIEIRYDE